MNEFTLALLRAYARGYHHGMSLMPAESDELAYRDGYALGLKEYADQYQWDAILESRSEVPF